ncbi:hypothetical protein BCR35DRAFT_301531 [Leucosporidium creatinivorum]|uniref:Zn(2)-C6 fungal-type domain-containing protein n=1 Tax=Leucosporidium creatinivorum TaxID=106004 RepID=A0A1Y2FWM1_9BASI|nr:hypothetical protein BCR35DRAFT_301531 [Leucosporidium creatinivorum]
MDGTDATPSKRARSLVACTRCRQSRRKCINQGELAGACVACVSAKADCIFPPRGTSLVDRAPRGLRIHTKRQQAPAGEGSNASPPVASTSALVTSPTSSLVTAIATNGTLPPPELLLEAAEQLFSSYFQLFFLHKPTFLHTLATQPDSIRPFLLFSILAVSARFTPSLIARFGGSSPAHTSEHFTAQAHQLVLTELLTPTLEGIQGLYLLGVVDFGAGKGFRSKALQGLALQMAEMLQLHVDAPHLPPIELEVRRRTWWFLGLNLNLLSVGSQPSPLFDPLIYPIPLPQTEEDFTFGVASSAETWRDVKDGRCSTTPSFLTSLLHISAIWGDTARALAAQTAPGPPWHPDSLYETTSKAMRGWLAKLGERNKWSISNLLAYKSRGLDLAFFANLVQLNTTQLAIRRQYLPFLLRVLHPDAVEGTVLLEGQLPPTNRFWRNMAESMITTAIDLVSLQEQVNQVRGNSGTAGTPFQGFSIFLAGSVLCYAKLCPWLSSKSESQVGDAIGKAIVILSRLMSTWTIGERWYTSLLAQASMVDSSAQDHARRQLGEDRSDGIYRQFTQDYDPPPRASAPIPAADPPPPPPPPAPELAPSFGEAESWADMSLPMGMGWSGLEATAPEPFVFQGFDLQQLESDLSTFAGLDFGFGGGIDGGMQG